MNAGQLRERLSFEKRVDLAEPGNRSGTKRGNWQQQFQPFAAAIQYLRGGETVMASRLSGIQPAIITVRACSETRMIDASWRARDVRSGAIFNIKAPNPTADNKWIEFVAETGGAIG